VRDGSPSGARRWAFDSGSTRSATARPRAAGTRPLIFAIIKPPSSSSSLISSTRCKNGAVQGFQGRSRSSSDPYGPASACFDRRACLRDPSRCCPRPPGVRKQSAWPQTVLHAGQSTTATSQNLAAPRLETCFGKRTIKIQGPATPSIALMPRSSASTIQLQDGREAPEFTANTVASSEFQNVGRTS